MSDVRYASICQAAGIVPIVEPEVLCDGAHNLGTVVHQEGLILVLLNLIKIGIAQSY